EEEERRWERAKSEAVAATQLVQSLEGELERLAGALESSATERSSLGAALEALELGAASAKNHLLLAEQQEKGARAGLDEARGRLSQAEVEVARLEVERKHLETATVEEMGLSLDRLRDLPLPEEGFSAAKIEEEIADLKGRLERLGAVNLAALEQYQ